MYRGLIIKSTGSWYQVLSEESGEVFEARIRGKFKLVKTGLTNPLAVGDRVDFVLEKDGVAWINRIHPRQNYLIRKAVNLSKEAHIIAANVDLACFIFTVNYPETSFGFLDRFLVCCEAYSIKAIILINKVDLLNTNELKVSKVIAEVYRQIGYDVLEISSFSGKNLDVLQGKLKNRTSVFFGHSGSGKSTLVNTLQPGLDLRTSEISATHSKGKHTTTFAQMHFWTFGGAVIDTPGVREFAMTDVEKKEIQHYFPEILREKVNCRFHNCLHINEPKCAVAEAVEHGEIELSRYETYLKLMQEADSQQAF